MNAILQSQPDEAGSLEAAVAADVDSPLNWRLCWAQWPLASALRLKVVVAEDGAGALWALSASEPQPLHRELLTRSVGQPLLWRTLDEETLGVLLARGEQAFEARGVFVHQATDGGPREDGQPHALSVEAISRQSSPVIRLLDATLFDALKAQASDLHLESTATGMVIRHRLDGVMVRVGEVPDRKSVV